MDITTYDVRGRTKRHAIAAASIADFDLAPGMRMHDPGFLVETATVLPYCIDPARGMVVLVELPSVTELASVPFLYDAQYRGAVHVHTITIEGFVALTAGLAPQAKAIFLHSTGRCGSTLLARALGEVAGVTMLSEPDVFSQLAMAGRLPEGAARAEFEALYAGFLRFFLRNRTGRVVFKFRGVVCEHAEYLASALPGSVSVFLYRDAVAVTRSYARLINRPLSMWQLSEGQCRAWSRFAPLVAQLDSPINGYDLIAALWAGPVLQYLNTWPAGIWHGAIDYADLLADPCRIGGAMLGDLRQGAAPVAFPAHVFATHSQADSHLAPNRIDPNPDLEAELISPDFPGQIARSLQRIDPRLRADMKLPGNLAA